MNNQETKPKFFGRRQGRVIHKAKSFLLKNFLPCILLNNSGKSRVGYNVVELKLSIEKTLGFSKTKNAIIIGAGNLGMALAKYGNFSNYGLNIVSLYDNDPLKIGTVINDMEIFDIKNLNVETKADIAILTVPGAYAQKSAQYLVDIGIKYIWNFTPTVLDVPQGVQVWNENLMGNFLQFTFNM